MTETKSEWTKDHPRAVGWWVCADGAKRLVVGHGSEGEPIGIVNPICRPLNGLWLPIRPYVETKKIEVEAWACILMDGTIEDTYDSEKDARAHFSHCGPFTVVRLTGTAEIEA